MARRAEPIKPPVEPRRERVAAFRLGLSAESRAAMFLIAKGYRIAARRWKTPFGEIDIVARRRRVLVFVEVKARERADDAAEAVTERAKRGSLPQPSFGSLIIPMMRSTTSASMSCS
jgi:putative endonuclease